LKVGEVGEAEKDEQHARDIDAIINSARTF
jgi:hypothetical protein